MQIPCPNPACSHVFSQAEIQRSSALKCPRCGHEFRLRSEPARQSSSPPPAATRPAPAKPMAKPAAPPLAKPVQPRPAPAAIKPVTASLRSVNPFADESLPEPAAKPEPENVDFGPPVSLIRRSGSPRRKPRGWVTYVVLAVVALIAIGGIVTAVNFIEWPEQTKRGVQEGGRNYVVSVRTQKNADEKAFKVTLAETDSWKPDKNLLDDFRLRDETEDTGETGVHLALRNRDKDELWVAITAKDYGMQLPRSAEMLYQASIRLRKFFGDSLETGTKAEPVTLAGQSGHRLRFKGENRSVVHRGECYMIAAQGFGYWLFIGGPSLAEARQGLTELQENNLGFAVATDRRGWREQPPKMVTFHGTRLPYSLSAIEGIWDIQANGRDFEENSDLLLLGTYAKEKNNRKNSSVMVLLLPKQDSLKEAVQYSRKYVEERRKNGPKNFAYSHVVINPDGEDAAKESELGYSADVGNKKGRIVEMKVLLGDDPARYLLLAVVNDPDALVVVWCECIWEHRQIWREDFRELLSTMNIRKKE